LNSVGLAVDPFDSRHLFAWSPTRDFESTDGGANWSLALGISGDRIFHPAVAGVVYASRFNDVQRSNDGGKTWTSLANGLPKSHSLFVIGAGGTVYLGDSSGGVFVFESAAGHEGEVRPRAEEDAADLVEGGVGHGCLPRRSCPCTSGR
jgi:hypothetical protein